MNILKDRKMERTRRDPRTAIFVAVISSVCCSSLRFIQARKFLLKCNKRISKTTKRKTHRERETEKMNEKKSSSTVRTKTRIALTRHRKWRQKSSSEKKWKDKQRMYELAHTHTPPRKKILLKEHKANNSQLSKCICLEWNGCVDNDDDVTGAKNNQKTNLHLSFRL